MKINRINNNYQTKNKINFKARDYAIVKTLVDEQIVPLKLFEINDNDTKFLDLMSQNINLKRLSCFKDATTKQIRKWKTMINNAIMMSGFNEPQRSFLLTTNSNKPCGIISYKNIFGHTDLDYLASWPIGEGKKVKFAGTALMKNLFEDSIDNGTKKITLTTLSDSPVDLIKFYGKMGFDTVDTSINGTEMISLREKFLEKSKALDSTISIEKIKCPKDVNLKRILDIDFR